MNNSVAIIVFGILFPGAFGALARTLALSDVCAPSATLLPAYVIAVTHVALIVIQIGGRIFIYRLSPDWD